MPRRKSKKQYTEEKNRTIFIIKNPLTKEFFIGHTPSHNIRSTYKDHYNETKYKTAGMISGLKYNGYKPCCFILDELYCTPVQAYRYVIIWTKIFVELGYTPLDEGTIQEYIKNILPENQGIYSERKSRNANEILQCENCLFPDYGRKKCLLKEKMQNE